MPKILIADDNDGITYVMKVLMEGRGLTTAVTEDGQKTLDRSSNRNPTSWCWTS
jgi:CheY-like chemotaxis protein